MTKPGPKPKPTSLRLLHGDRKDRINAAEPPVPAGLDPASGLSPSARTLWRRIAPSLERRSGAGDWDRESLAVYCEAVVMNRKAAADVAKRGVLVAGDRGRVKNPSLQIFRDTAAVVRAFAQEFGLTPSSRQGIKVPEASDDERDALFS